MKDTIAHLFDVHMQKMYNYIQALMYETKIPSPHKTYSGLRAVLHTFRDCLTVEEAAHLSAQLPMIMRGIFYEGWVPSATPKKIKDLDDFFYNVSVEASNTLTISEAEQMTYATLFILNQYISEGELDKLKKILPKHLKNILP